ncbi:MAG: hypothetical protein ACP5NP_01540 [Acetobacteraceae bacterium]
MSGQGPGGYVPLDIDAAVPADPAARAEREAALEADTTRRDLLSGQLARLRAALYAAEAAGDRARAAALEAEIAALAAARDAL